MNRSQTPIFGELPKRYRVARGPTRHGAGHGLRLLHGGCRQREGQEPYAPLLDALARHVHALTVAQARLELRGCAWLVRLLPELADGPIEPLPTWTLSPVQERR